MYACVRCAGRPDAPLRCFAFSRRILLASVCWARHARLPQVGTHLRSTSSKVSVGDCTLESHSQGVPAGTYRSRAAVHLAHLAPARLRVALVSDDFEPFEEEVVPPDPPRVRCAMGRSGRTLRAGACRL